MALSPAVLARGGGLLVLLWLGLLIVCARAHAVAPAACWPSST